MTNVEGGVPPKFYKEITDPSIHGIPTVLLNRTIATLDEEPGAVRQSTKDHYRRSKTEILRTANLARKRAPRGEPTSALILGAGRCNDIPVEDLARSFSRLTFIEQSSQRTKAVIEQLPPHLQEKITIVTADLSGVAGKLITGWQRADEQSTSPDTFIEAMLDTVASIKNRDQVPEMGTHTFVSSHLILSQIDDLPYSYAKTLLDKHRPLRPAELRITTRLHTDLQSAHMQALSNSIKPEGIVHFSDTYTCKRPGEKELTPDIDSDLLHATRDRLFTSELRGQWNWMTETDSMFGVYSFMLQPRRTELTALFGNHADTSLFRRH